MDQRQSTHMKLRTCLRSALLGLVLVACSTVPGTGRTQFLLISTEQEMALGAQAYSETLAGVTLVTSGPEAEMVQRLGRRISQAAIELYPDPAELFEWEFVLIDDPQTANAWALPGGKTAVYTGILPITQDEDGLAAVVGHEVAHAIAHHGGERISHNLGAGFALEAVGAYLGSRDSISQGDREAIMAGLGAGATVGVLLPFSRKHESEADELGVYMAAKAGYDPRAAIGLWGAHGCRGRRPAAAGIPEHPPLRGNAHRAPQGGDAEGHAVLPRVAEQVSPRRRPWRTRFPGSSRCSASSRPTTMQRSTPSWRPTLSATI